MAADSGIPTSSDDDNWTLHPILDNTAVVELGTGVSIENVIKKNMWYVLASENGPGSRIGHGVVAVDNNLVLFGGAVPGQPYNDVHVLNLATFGWSELKCSGNKPVARYEQVFVRIAGTSRICLFGGADLNGNLNDIFVLNTDTGEWTEPTISGTPPSARTMLCGADCIGDYLYIFGGGEAGQEPVSDASLHRLDLEKWAWSTVDIEGSAPTSRQGHSLRACGTKLYLFGGMGSQTFYDDLWVFDTVSNEWSCAKTSGDSPMARSAHGATVIDKNMYIGGGLGLLPGSDPNIGPQPGPLDDMLKLDTETLIWSTPKLNSAPFNSRLDFSLTAVKLFKIGGDSSAINPISEIPTPLLSSATASTDNNGSAPRIEDITGQLVGNNPDRPVIDNLKTTETYSPVTENEFDGILVYGGMDTSGVFDDCMFLRL